MAAGEAALAEARVVLGIDARHRQIRQALPQIAVRLAAAKERNGDLEGAIATLSVLLELDVGQQGRETGALIMGQYALTLPESEHRREVLARVETELRRALTTRGRRDVRALEVRLMLANLHEAAGAVHEQEVEVKAAIEMLASLPKVPPDRLRNLFAMAAELALGRGDTETAAAHVATMLDRVGPGGGGNYLGAVLLSRCAAGNSDAALCQSYAARAVAYLAAALERKEVPAAALQHANFDPLRERADFKALVSGR
jgi:hypothetical protein